MNTKYFFPGIVARLPSTLPSSAFIYHKTYSCCCGNGVLDIILPESCKIKFTRGFISELHLVISEFFTLRSLNFQFFANPLSTQLLFFTYCIPTYHGSSICISCWAIRSSDYYSKRVDKQGEYDSKRFLVRTTEFG